MNLPLLYPHSNIDFLAIIPFINLKYESNWFPNHLELVNVYPEKINALLEIVLRIYETNFIFDCKLKTFALMNLYVKTFCNNQFNYFYFKNFSKN